jgi:hypothetical protein
LSGFVVLMTTAGVFATSASTNRFAVLPSGVLISGQSSPRSRSFCSMKTPWGNLQGDDKRVAIDHATKFDRVGEEVGLRCIRDIAQTVVAGDPHDVALGEPFRLFKRERPVGGRV